MSFFSKLWNSLKAFGIRVGSYARTHKIIAAIVVIAIIGAGYWGYTVFAADKASAEYVLNTATEGPLQVTVTESGQVSSNDTLSLSPKASGEVTEVNVTPGESVKAGTIIGEIDMTDAAQAVESAKENLESAQISYQQTLTSSQNGTANDQTSVQTAQTNAQNSITSTFTDLPTVMNGIDSVLHSLSTAPGYTAEQNVDAYANYINTSESQQYRSAAVAAYTAAVASYQRAQSEYVNETANPSVTDTVELAQDSAQATKDIATLLQDTLTYYNYINDQATVGKIPVPSQLTSQISSVTSYLSTVNGDTTSLMSGATSLTNAEQTLQQNTQTLAGNSTPLDIQSAQLSLQKSQEALTQAETAEEDYIVRAPFDGVIASVSAKKYDQASSGTAMATLITTGNYVDLSLNEADIAKIQVGQPASLTFDAIDGLTATGTVAEVDPVGTVSQGVVTYDVKVGLDTVDSRIKPGMTADATIVTSSVADAIQVPSAAVHTTGNSSYVEVATLKNASSTTAMGGMGSSTRGARTASSTGGFAGRAGMASSTGAGAFGSSTAFAMSGSTLGTTRALTVPEDQVTITRVPVTLGISNDTMVQIMSGLKKGQLVVTSTIAGTTAKKPATSASAASLLGGGARATTGAATGARTASFGGGGAGAAGGFVRGGG